MSLVMQISLRNLLRQKRRNILLGIAIAFGALILVLANSFAHGISDVLFNKIVVYVSGHVSVNFSERGNMMRQVFRDGDRMMQITKEKVPEIVTIQEAVGIMSRAIGNGKADNVIMVGMDLNQTGDAKTVAETKDNFKMIEGSFESLANDSIENPVLLAKEKADYLNVKLGDILRVRFKTVEGQEQAVRLTVAGIFKPANMFMQAPIFLEIGTLKKLAGYGPHDIGQLYLTIKDPRKNASKVADVLYDAFKPDVAVIEGALTKNNTESAIAVLGFRNDSLSNSTLLKSFSLTAGDPAVAFGKNGVVASASLAGNLSLIPGDTCLVRYVAKHNRDTVAMSCVVSGILPERFDGQFIMVNETHFYETFYDKWPASPTSSLVMPTLLKDTVVTSALATEWILMDRSKTTKELQKNYKVMVRKKVKATLVDVRSMYESASAVLNLEAALNVITFVAVMILFFIILIGVINTLRMSIRERTKEIGTIRAIGMQKRDVRNVFVLETLFLAMTASLVGTGLAFVTMWLLSLITIDAAGNPMGMLLVNGHLNFVPTVAAIIFYNVLIWAIASLTAFFPARRAANLLAADALRHIE